MSELDLVKRLNDLQRQVDGLIKPEVPLGVSLISETVLSISATSITFSSIPQGFRHLVVYTYARIDGAAELDDIYTRFNGDSGSNYDWQMLYGNSATTGAAVTRATTGMLSSRAEGANSRANCFAAGIQFVLNYSLNVNEKNCITLTDTIGNLSADADMWALLRTGHWRSFAPVTSVTISPVTGPNFIALSRFQLYGIM